MLCHGIGLLLDNLPKKTADVVYSVAKFKESKELRTVTVNFSCQCVTC